MSTTRRMVRRATIKGRLVIAVKWAWVIAISGAVLYLLLTR